MVKILNEILSKLPKEKIVSVEFEAANIVIYTNDINFLISGRSEVGKLVSFYKKRIELRADKSILKSQEETSKRIGEVFKGAIVKETLFEDARSKVTVFVENVGNAIGRGGENLKGLQKETGWSFSILRCPLIKSRTVSSIRAVEFQENEYRRKFLDRIGRKIYGGYTKEKIKTWARITMLGSAMQIGRSSILLQTQESRILLDCGIDPSLPLTDHNIFPYLDSPDFKLEEIDAVVLSHAHMDHCGLLPYLYKLGFKGPIYCTEPTRDLITLSLIDFIKISNMAKDVKPLYRVEDIKEMLKHIITIDLEEVTDVTSDIKLTMYNSGHILGGAFCHLNIGNGLHNFLYTGDFNYNNKQLLLNKAHTNFLRIESMLLETTNAHQSDISISKEDAYEEMLKIILDVYVKKGKILIPSFGIGKAQEIILAIEKLIREERLPKDIKIYVDGMIYEVVSIHLAYPNYLNYNLRKRILENDNPFLMENFVEVSSHEKREEIINSNEPCIVLATSGMLNGGTSVEYFKNFADNENNAIIFVGYQAKGTLGRRVKDGEKEILLENSGSENSKLKVNLQVHHMKGAFSGHSDFLMTKNFVNHIGIKPKKIILNHGDPQKINYFKNYLEKRYDNLKVFNPENLDSIRLI